MNSNLKILKRILILVLLIIANCVSIFSNELDVKILNNPSPGYFNLSGGFNHAISIALFDNYGEYHYEGGEFVGLGGMQKFLSDGNWYIFGFTRNMIYQLNTDLVFTDSIDVNFLGDSLGFDYHDMLIMPDGKYLIGLTKIRIMDLSQIIEGGHSDANVTGVKLVQVDKFGNISWSWDCFDYLNITEATNDIDLTQKSIDFSHFNALAVDKDGHILVSLRNLDQIIKINKDNGNIIWRLGGSASRINNFTFTNDSLEGFYGFSHQHSINILPNGNLLLFDNGNLKPTQYSRAVEYQINQTNYTVKKVWEYRKSPDFFAVNMGSVQRLENGNTLINWGFESFQEIKSNGEIAFEAAIDYIYKIIKIPVNMDAVTLRISNNGTYNFSDVKNNTNISMDIQSKTGSGLTWIEKHYYQPPVANFSTEDFSSILSYRWVITSDSVKSANGKIKINIENLEGIISPQKLTIYKRNKETTGNFSPLNTSYNSTTKELSASFSGFGEFVICSNVLSVPTLFFPANHSARMNTTTQLVWNKLRGALSYRVQIAKDNSFTDIIRDSIITNDTAFVVSYLDYNTNYYWRVLGMNSKDTSQWSLVRDFKTKIFPPELLSPENKKYSFGLRDTLLWNYWGTNARYHVQISEDSSFFTIAEEKSNLTFNYYVANSLKNNTNYFWRVSVTMDSDTSDFSQHRTFTTKMSIPELFAPKIDSVNITNEVILQWFKVSGANSYIVELAKDKNFTDTTLQIVNSANTDILINNLKNNSKYYWRVKAIRITDSSDFSDVYHFYTILNQPKLFSPVHDTTGIRAEFIFEWLRPDSNDYYQIQIAYDYNFDNIIIDSSNLINNYLGIKELPGFTRFFWRVRYNSGKRISHWSDIWGFTTGKGIELVAPVLLNPKNNSMNQKNSGVFDWLTADKALKYRIQISKDPEFNKLISDSSDIFVNSFVYKNYDYETNYYWRVKAFSIYDSSEWSIHWTMQTLKKPSLVEVFLIKPKYDALQVLVIDTLKWQKVSNAKTYQLQVSEVENFSHLAISEEHLPLNHYLYDNLHKNKTYFWRVRYISTIDTSAWSDVWEFTTEADKHLFAPKLIQPTDDLYSVPVKGLLEWEAVDDATSYKISVSQNESFFPRFINISWHKDLNLQYSNLEYNTLYYWRVAGQNDNTTSPWSVTKMFTTELRYVSEVIPANGNKEVTPKGNIEWEQIEGATNYHIIISDDIDYGNIIIDEKINSNTFEYNLQDDKQYYWKLKAFNEKNSSRWRDFSFVIPPTSSVLQVNESNIKIYPNPTQGKLFIELDEYEKYYIEIFDCLGNVIFKDVIGYNGENQHFINLESLNEGFYFMVLSNSKSIKTFKIIKLGD